MAHVVVQIQVSSGKDVGFGVVSEAQCGAQKLRLEVVKFVWQARFLWVFAGQIVHRGQRFPRRQRRIGLEGKGGSLAHRFRLRSLPATSHLRGRLHHRLRLRLELEQRVDHIAANVSHHVQEQLIAFALVFNQWVFLPIAAQPNRFAQGVHLL